MSTPEQQSEDIEIRIRKETHGYTVSGRYMKITSQTSIADLNELESAIDHIKQVGMDYWK